MVKKYIPNDKEKYMCEKHKKYFKKRLLEWKNELLAANANNLHLNGAEEEVSSADIVDQASSQTDKNVEMRTLNRQIKLIAKIDKAIKKINENAFVGIIKYCHTCQILAPSKSYCIGSC